MSELKEIYELHKSCQFKDKDIAKAFERRCTPQNVKELFRVIEAVMAENSRLHDHIINLENTYVNSMVKGCNS